MRRRQFVAATGLSVFGVGPLAAEPSRHIVMASLVSNKEGFPSRWLHLIYTDAFHQLGYTLEIRVLPAARASAEAAAGHVDGELARSYEYAAAQPNLVRVPEPTFFATTTAYARRADIHLSPGWDGLRGARYRVEYRLGYPVIGSKLAAVVAPGYLGGVQNAETGLRKLALGRSDLYVDVADTVDALLVRAEFADAGIHPVAELGRGPIHAFLGKQHAALAPRLGAVLKKLRESGQTERYRQQALRG